MDTKPLASSVGFKKKVRFAMQEPDRAGPERPSGAASGLQTSSNHKRVSTMRSAHETQPRSDTASNGRASPRPDETVHTTVPETAQRRKSNDGTVFGRTVTRYNGNSSEVTIDRSVEQSQPNIPKRDTMLVMTYSLLTDGANQISPRQISVK